MPAGTGAGASNNTGPGSRTVFRPPWVKETQNSAPVAPWTLNKRGKEGQATVNNTQPEAENTPVRKTSKITIVPSQPNENGTSMPQKPATNARLASREIKVPVLSEKKIPIQRDDSVQNQQMKPKNVPIQREETKPIPDRSSKVVPIQVEDDRRPNNASKTIPIRREDSRPTERPKLAAQSTMKDVDFEEPTLNDNKFSMVKLRETTTRDAENTPVKKENTFPAVKLREVSRDQENSTPVKKENKFPAVKLRETQRNDQEIVIPTKENKFPEVKLRETKNLPPLKEDVDKQQARDTIEKALPRKPSLIKQGSMNKIPPPPPMAPPMPPPQPRILPDNYQPLTQTQKSTLEFLRSRPRKRPDWATMMKEVEEGKKLKHVVCNDRSKPLLPAGKTKTIEGKFIYESEKSNLHNQLLKQIQAGINLKTVQTNDRSKPMIDGLRKFRRQMTIEEQIQKSQSTVTIPDGTGGEVEVVVPDEEIDEMDDIDTIRDDLQSTKQLLALEMRNKEAQIRENKRLQSRILNLETELDRERGKAAASVTRSVMAERIEDEKLVTNLKQEADSARKAAKDMEKKYLQASDLLDTAKGDLEEQRRQNAILEKRLEQALKMLNGGGSRRESQAVGGEDEIENEQVSESESDGEDTEEKKEKRAKRELKLLTNKLRNFKDKEANARKERLALKEQMKKQQELIKEERKKFKALQREVDKMAAMMKDDEIPEDEEKEEKEYVDDEENEEVSEEESETESESESSSDEEDEKSESEQEDAPIEKKKDNYTNRVRRHESCLGALKKGNYLLKANIDRLKEDLNKQREDIVTLQEDLDSVLSELG